MIEYGNLILIGSSHISPASVREVKKTIASEQPDFVAIELDRDRLHSLLQKKRKRAGLAELRALGIRGFLFALFGQWVEEKLGKVVKTKPGTEMKVAVAEAAKIEAKLLLIDQDIKITIKRLFKAITWTERFRFFWDIVSAPFQKRKIQFDLAGVPSAAVIKTLIDEVKIRYPSVYSVLIHERNVVMARKLRKVMDKYPEKQIVAIVGAGHVEGMLAILKKA